jgi:alpha-L-fucosidase
VPAYAPVIPGKLAYAEWYWHQMTERPRQPKANAIETGTWAYHQKMYGADFPYQNFRARSFAPIVRSRSMGGRFSAPARSMSC